MTLGSLSQHVEGMRYTGDAYFPSSARIGIETAPAPATASLPPHSRDRPRLPHWRPELCVADPAAGRLRLVTLQQVCAEPDGLHGCEHVGAISGKFN